MTTLKPGQGRVLSPGRDRDGSIRRGRVFSMRLTPEEEDKLRALQAEHERQTTYWMRYGLQHERGGLGPFIVWAALQWTPPTRIEKKPTTKKGRQLRMPRAA